MANINLKVNVTYQGIGDHCILVHLFGCKVNRWMLLDLSEISNQTGKSYEQILQALFKRNEAR